MSMKTVLAKNLKALMAQRPGLDTLPKITKATNGALSNGKLDRVRRAAVATDIDTIEQLAQVFGVAPAALLEEGPRAKADVPLSTASAGALGDAMRLVASAVIQVDDDDTRTALARMFSLLISQPAKAGTTAQSIALLLSGASIGNVPAETRTPAAPIQEVELDIEEEHGTGDTLQEHKRRKTRGG